MNAFNRQSNRDTVPFTIFYQSGKILLLFEDLPEEKNIKDKLKTLAGIIVQRFIKSINVFKRSGA